MLGGPSIMFQKPTGRSSGRQGGAVPQWRASPHFDLLPPWGSGLKDAAAASAESMQPWLQQVCLMLDEGGRSLASHFHKLKDREPQSQLRCSDNRLSFPAQNLCFASISSTFNKQDHHDPQAKVEDLKESAGKLGEDLRVPVPQAKVPGVGDVKSLAVKQLLCGIFAGAVASFAVSPFEVLRTRVIAGRGGSSAAEVLGTITKIEGIQSLFKGNLKVTLFATSIQKGMQFATFEAVKRKEQQKLGEDPKWLPGVSKKVPVATVAGAVAGLTSTLVVYPFTTLMDRLLLQPSEYPSLVGSAMKLIKEGTISELYRGIIPAILTMIPQAALSFYTFETVSKNLRNKRVQKYGHDNGGGGAASASVSVAAGTAAGLVAAALTYPLEVARKQISLSALPKGTVGVGGALVYENLLQALGGIVKREGFTGLYRGFVVEALHFVPMTAISFVVYEIAKRALVAQHEERRDEVKG